MHCRSSRQGPRHLCCRLRSDLSHAYKKVTWFPAGAAKLPNPSLKVWIGKKSRGQGIWMCWERPDPVCSRFSVWRTNAVLMMGKRQRRLPIINPALSPRLLSYGQHVTEQCRFLDLCFSHSHPTPHTLRHSVLSWDICYFSLQQRRYLKRLRDRVLPQYYNDNYSIPLYANVGMSAVKWNRLSQTGTFVILSLPQHVFTSNWSSVTIH